MPANRSRTERWRDCLEQIRDRGGGIELAVHTPADPHGAQPPMQLLWRVRVLKVAEQEILVESPNAAGSRVDFADGLRLVAVMSIGQNRWMFHTSVLGGVDRPTSAGAGGRALRLAIPTSVERCQRRGFLRITTAELVPTPVECHQIINPTTVPAAEIANREQIRALEEARASIPANARIEPLVLPEVGPVFPARLMNIGGGGVGLLITKDDRSSVETTKLYWVRLDLRPHIPAPLGITARMAHTHVDSEQNLYAGMAFEFALHPEHRGFVVEQIGRYVAKIQAAQLLSRAA